MNEVIISGILKGDFQDVSNDGVLFHLVTKTGRGDMGIDEFITLAYGKAAEFLKERGESGKRLVVQGRLSSEKLDTDNYHTAVTVSRVLSVGDSSEGMDYTHAVISGTAESDGLRQLEKGTQLANLNIANKRTYTSRDGSTGEYTTYLGATVWSTRAVALDAEGVFPMKDTEVILDGILKPRSYEKDGEEVFKIDVWVNDLSIVGTEMDTPTPKAKKSTAKKAPASKSRKGFKDGEGSPF